MTDAINNSVNSSIENVSTGNNPINNHLDSRSQSNPSTTPPSVNEAQQSISEINQEKRDLTTLIAEEIQKEAKFQTRVMKQQIKDQLQEGGWDAALNEFIEDFVIYPTAYMKGPIVTKKKRLKWKNGTPTVDYDYVFMNERVDPLDMYLSPSAKTLQEGNLLEHVRYNSRTLSELKKNPAYKADAIERVLEVNGYAPWLDTSIESVKATEEMRGTAYDMNRDIIHGLHFFGSVQVSKLREWGLQLFEYDDTDEVEVEAILVGNEVIKCDLNKDPLLRRPYYSASFYNRPGSLVGRSLPEMMQDIQRMCNATARALSNNLGIASGPMMEVYIDRLADDGDIEELKPMKIFQLVSDPTGSGGRAINFFQPQSNAAELLAVYEKFELKADDVTGIPKYAYGNESSLANYEKVLTPTGAVPISLLEVGDKVCNTYGTTSNVLGVYPQGECDIFSIKFSNNTSVDCTMDHLWNVATNDKFSTKSLEELLEEGLFRKDGVRYRPKFKLPPTSCVEYIEQEVPVDPYTLGAWLGDGCKGTGKISGIDLEVFEAIPYEITHIKNSVCHNCLGLITDLKKTKVWDKGSFTKFIPEDYLKNTEECRLELLRGLMDTDGCCAENGRLIYTTSSRKLRDTFIELVKSLGGTTKGYSTNVKERYKPSYKITFQYNDLTVPLFKISRKEERRVEKRSNHTIYITGLDYVGKNEATCIKVDSKDRLYVVDNLIPTHNTGGAATTASGLSLILEAASKIIKDAVRNIDIGLIKPRVEFQFYYNLIKNKNKVDFSGDINVVPMGSTTLTVKAAQQIRRNEFLQITANPVDQELMGVEGRASLLREIGKDLGLDTNPVPGPVDLKRAQKKKEENAQAAAQAQSEKEQADRQAGLAATEIQINGQKEMHADTQQFKATELATNTDQKEKDRQANMLKVQTDAQVSSAKIESDNSRNERTESNKEGMQIREVALSLSTDDKVN
ncbi:hypothetical protein DRQ25_11895 [Candidatus Fermentibacteria bacterium]|nr:MAG: hypothetical protein DRQ25_11895 [Candidatus Fermentibacteria bacterium]